MSVYTPVSAEELAEFLRQYPVGELFGFAGIEAGVENTNYFVTTTGGAFVLTLFEQHSPEDLEYFLALMQHWADAGIPVACPQHQHDGSMLATLKGKPAALVARLPGSHLETPTPEQCAALGTILAQMHVSGQRFPLYRAQNRGHEWRMAMGNKVLAQLAGDEAELLRTELNHQQTIPFGQLPTGITHADLFRDNVLFNGGQLSGILDLYFACNGSWLYDLAVVVNDWCCQPDGSLAIPRLQALISAYQAVRPWEPVEQHYWQATLRAAALRFWLSRLDAVLNPRDGDMILQKDPTEFRDKLLHRIAEDQALPANIMLDARRLLCPLPVIRVQEAVENLPAGVTVTAVCTDPGALHDIPAWARIHGHRVLETRSEGREHTIVLQTGNVE
ncbi:homoserine kinase [Thiothrix nivea]|uniref:Homoserine kinase n=1 Tax=Thiothrix nivea (strain ATCC 35100 / DSM 5205 / JP2) TaxID=870187 RepID=A0A656HFP5_THINJ|nr:homoserine kinase [Thiothrix nivea]EIJ35748.1 homoserine kinase [Thiothrix nivea DSM 5205]